MKFLSNKMSKHASKENNLAVHSPNLIQIWHPTKNFNLTPYDVMPFSHRRVWWKCTVGHEWQATVGNVSKGSNCPICWRINGASEKAIINRGSLAYRFPEVAAQWHPIKNGDLSPDKVSSRSSRKAWWLCPKGHESHQAISSRAAGIGCPKCGLKKQADSLRRNTVKRKGSITETHPHLLTEWHPTKNKNISPHQISFGSHESIWWVCKHGHEWQAQLKSRAKGHGCPYCSTQSSRLEIRLLCELRILFTEVIWRKRFPPYECDILLPELSVGVEVDGFIWHKDKPEQDRQKNKLLAEQEVELIRVRGAGLPKVAEHDIYYKETEKPLSVIHRLLELLVTRVSNGVIQKKIDEYLSANRFVNEKEYKKILAALPTPSPERSLEAVCPHLLKEWHPRNLPLTPAMFPAFTHKKVWWLCPKGHDDYLASISHRTNGKGCPVCGRESRGASTTRAAIKRSGTVEQNYPHLLKEWNPTKNKTINPNNISPGSKKKIWWICEHGHEWTASVVNRTKQNSGCPVCKREGVGNAIASAAVRRSGSLAMRFPNIAKEWNTLKNPLQTPNDVSPKSNKRVWWICEQGHEWSATIASRTNNNSACPYCNGLLPTDKTSLLSINPSLALQWHSKKNGKLTPADVLPHSNKKVWWLCSRGHEWDAQVSRRSNGQGCPICHKQRRKHF